MMQYFFNVKSGFQNKVLKKLTYFVLSVLNKKSYIGLIEFVLKSVKSVMCVCYLLLLLIQIINT